MLPSVEELKATVEQQLPGVSLGIEGLPAAPGAAQAGGALIVSAKDLTSVCRYLKGTERFHMDYLADLTVVDYPPVPAIAPGGPRPDPASGGAGRMDVVYHLYSMEKKHGPIALHVQLPRQQPVVSSVTSIWRGAEFQEREAYDLFGVMFEGHPDLRRILMWEGFEGYPMRKDYVPEDQNVLEERPQDVRGG